MLKHAAVVAVSVLSAVAAAQALTTFVTPPAAAVAVAPGSGSAGASPPIEGVMRVPLAPPPLDAARSPPTAAQVTKSADGHFWAQAEVNGRWVRFLVDTGASAVALTGADAQRLGLDLSTLDYDRPVVTANGQARAATIRLDHVTVAGARVDDVDALVVKEGLSASLLGMSYLGRLSRFEATRTALILRP